MFPWKHHETSILRLFPLLGSSPRTQRLHIEGDESPGARESAQDVLRVTSWHQGDGRQPGGRKFRWQQLAYIYILHYVLYYVYTVYVYVCIYIYSVKQYIRHSWTLSYNIIYSNPPKKDINVESQELLFLWSFHNPEMSHPQVLDRRCNPHRDHQRCHRLGNSYVHFSWRKHQKTRLKGWTCASEATRSPHSFVCLASKWWFAANLRPKMRKTMRFWGVHKIFPENQNRAMEYIPSLVEILRVTGDEWTGTFSSLRYNSMILKTC